MSPTIADEREAVQDKLELLGLAIQGLTRISEESALTPKDFERVNILALDLSRDLEKILQPPAPSQDTRASSQATPIDPHRGCLRPLSVEDAYKKATVLEYGLQGLASALEHGTIESGVRLQEDACAFLEIAMDLAAILAKAHIKEEDATSA
ncbi:MAG: hypothetical protein NTW68_05340 [candidate division NC10 bacterium]|nr:hypothetical protein [candidate division NC10 bacterium]